MSKKKSRGGPREGSGRNPVDDKMTPITFYVRESVVDKVGRDKLRQAAMDKAQELYEAKTKKK